MKWLYKLEYKYGKYYIPRLMSIIVFGMAIVYVLELATPDVSITSYLMLSRPALANWQLWRLVTFLFVPTQGQLFWFIISLVFYFYIGNSLEQIWGGFRFTLFYLTGWLFAIISALVIGVGSNSALNLSLFLAFATVAPDTEFRIFFILPVKAKWMALVYVGLMVIDVINAFAVTPFYGIVFLVSLGFSLVNYFIFCGSSLLTSVKDTIRIAKNRRNWRR